MMSNMKIRIEAPLKKENSQNSFKEKPLKLLKANKQSNKETQQSPGLFSKEDKLKFFSLYHSNNNPASTLRIIVTQFIWAFALKLKVS